MGLKVFTTPSVPLTKGQKNSGERGCNCPTVLNFLPLRLSCKENSTFSSSPSSMVFTPPSVPPFPGDRNLRKRGCNRPTVLFFRKSPRPSFLIKRAALGNLKASFHCTHWHRFFPLKKAFSKTYPSFLTLKEGSTSHLGLLPSGKKRETALLGARNRFALRLAGHQSPRHVVRDGTAWG